MFSVAMSEVILSLRDVAVDYHPVGGTRVAALSNITVEIHRGEKIAVFGPNGSGKSTLLRIMAGLERPGRGTVTILGQPNDSAELPPELRRRIGLVFQNPEDVFAAETVAEEIRFALECRDLDPAAIAPAVEQALNEYGLAPLAGRRLDRLSGGEQQCVALASVLAAAPEVIFLDEPTSFLDPPSRREFLRSPVFDSVAGTYTTVLVTQFWQEVCDFARVLVLENGKITYDGLPDDYEPADERKTAQMIELDRDWLTMVASPQVDPLLVVDNLTQTVPVFPGAMTCPLSDISFVVRPGERVGIIGPTGAGKSTLAYHLAGLMPKFEGRITIAGMELPSGKKKNDRAPVALLFQQPEHHLFAETVAQDVAFGPRNVGLAKDSIPAHVKRSLKLAGLSSDMFGPRSPFEISGGEQRKAATAGTLALPAAVYIFDEPTAYLDPQAAGHIEAVLLALAAEGKAVIVISHDLEFLRRTCPRWMILNQGRLIYDGPRNALNRDPTPLRIIGFA